MKTFPERLEQQIRFILEIDKLKSILRRTILINRSRRENSAEHSWQFALMAVLLAEYANEPVDWVKVVKMALIHDIVEIDADDTFIYDEAGALVKAEKEQKAAARLFGLLPPDQGTEFRQLWDEFEARKTPEARFAAALDRLIPILLNVNTEGKTWHDHGITSDRVIRRNQHMAEGSVPLWEYARAQIEKAVADGILADK
jgi:putative hydrolase of HD superfamily